MTESVPRRRRPKAAGYRRTTYIGVGVIAAVAIIAVVLIRVFGADDAVAAPALTARVGETTVEVPPYQYCDTADNCHTGDVIVVDTPPGATLTIELPQAVSTVAWNATIIRAGDDGEQADQQSFTAGQSTELVLSGGSDTELPLAGVEIRAVVLGAGEDGADDALNMVWAINTVATTPTGDDGEPK